jgi:protein TonB
VAGAQLAMSRAAGLDYRLGAALAVSLAVHAAVLSLRMPHRAPASVPALLQVRLLESPLVAAEPAQTVAETPVAEKSPPARRAPRKQVTVPVARSVSPPTVLIPSVPVADQTPAPVPAAPTLSAVPASPLQARSTVATPVPASRAPAPELLEGYGKIISQRLARYKEYPRIAQMRGWEGSVTMRLRVAPSGHLIDAELHTSSGHEVLDKQALAMVIQARQLPVPPEELSGGEVAVLVPIVFRLER